MREWLELMAFRGALCGVFGLLGASFACACGTHARPSPPAPAAPAPAPAARLIGRFAPGPAPSIARFAWSGSTIELRFRGASVALRLRAPAPPPHTERIDGKRVVVAEKTTAYAITVDAHAPFTLEVSPDRERYELASGLDPAAAHVVTAVREAEAFAGVHELVAVELGPEGVFLPSRSRALRIEVVGDSISCGYGVLGTDAKCSFSYATERASLAYGAVLGHMLDADVTTVCWSGRGVLRNYDGSTKGTMTELFERTLPESPATVWSFAAAPSPDVVVVNLGTNDFLGGAGAPLDLAAFENAYVDLARRIREVYARAWILLTTSPMLAGTVGDAARQRIEGVVARRSRDGDARVMLVPLDVASFDPEGRSSWGCDAHPGASMNARMAASIAARIRTLMLDSR